MEISKGSVLFTLIIVSSLICPRAKSQIQLFPESDPAFSPVMVSPVPGTLLACSKAGVAGEPASRKTASSDVLRGIILGRDLRDTLNEVAVEVFLLDQEGQIQRVFTGLAHSGKFSIPLLPASTHLLILRKKGYQSKSFLVEAAKTQEAQMFTLTGQQPSENPEEQLNRQKEEPLPPLLSSLEGEAMIDIGGLRSESNKMLAMMAMSASLQSPVAAGEFTERGAELSIPEPREEKNSGEALGQFEVTAATSFRQQATHQSAIILRFQSGDKVEVLEKTNHWWWRIRYKEQNGYVKARLLTPVP